MGAEAGGCHIVLKREDLCHTGAHKINNTLGQVLLARRMGKRRIIAETGAGQHGVATATAAALFGMPCDVYMGAVDVERQALNVFRMQLLGARGGAGAVRFAHAEGRDERGHPRLGHERPGHPLHHRLGGRTASLPGHGARLPVGDRRRGPRPDPPDRRAPSRRGGGLRRRWLQCHGDLLRLHRRPRGAARGRRGGRARPLQREARRGAGEGTPGRPPRLPELPAAGRRRAGRRRPTPSAPASTTRASGRSSPGSRTRGGSSCARPPTTRRSARWATWPARRGSSRRWRLPTRWRRRRTWPGSSGPRVCCW